MFLFINGLFSAGHISPTKPPAVQNFLHCAWCTNLFVVHAKCHPKNYGKAA